MWSLRLHTSFHYCVITSTLWFPRSLPYMINHMVFKFEHMVQDQPHGSRSNTDWTYAILLLFTESVLSFVYLNVAALVARNPTFAWTSRDSCLSERQEKKGARCLWTSKQSRKLRIDFLQNEERLGFYCLGICRSCAVRVVESNGLLW